MREADSGKREVGRFDPKDGVTGRAVAIALLLVPLNSFWVVQMESVYYSAHSTLFSLFFNVVFNLMVLVALNAPLRRFAPRWAFKRGEILTVYILLSQTSALAGHSLLQILPPTLASAFGLATPENDWRNLFGQYIPNWLAVTDTATLTNYITGGKRKATLYDPAHLAAWLTPALVWTGFVCVLLWTMLCVNVLFRKQWTERERLTYPIVQLPFDIADKASGLFRNPLFWGSFLVVAGMDVVNGLNAFIPSVPLLRIPSSDLGTFFTERPWNAVGRMALIFRPFALGLIYLIPLDITFSCWVFFFFWKAQLVLGSALGWQERPEFPEQSAGAYLSLVLFALWIGRHHLGRIPLSLFSLFDRDDADEPLPYRTALVGLFAGFGALLLFCWAAGMSLWAAGVFFALLLLTDLAVTRIRAEVGSPLHDLHFAGPEVLMVDALGTRNLGARNLTTLSFFWFLTRAHYSDVMPHQLEGFKLADRAGMNQRRVFAVSMLAAGVGTVAAFWAILHSGYGSQGVVIGWAGWEPFNRLSSWLSYPTAPDLAGVGFFLYGLLFGIFLMFLRLRFVWWTLHPAGYAVSSTYQMRDWWAMFLFIWFVKRLLLRYGGLKAQRRALPLFFGMILGEYVVGGFWAIIGVLLGRRTFNFTAWW